MLMQKFRKEIRLGVDHVMSICIWQKLIWLTMYTACFYLLWCRDKILMDSNGPCDFISVSKGQGQRRSSEVTYSSRRTGQLPYKRQLLCLLNLTSINSNDDEHHWCIERERINIFFYILMWLQASLTHYWCVQFNYFMLKILIYL